MLVTRIDVSSALQEHIEYLSTKGRYELFEAALANVICEGDVVADLGCGVGVLGLQCLQAGAEHVFGIDSSDAIHLARETMKRANLSEKYTCISGSTFDANLEVQVDALVCDHIGYFGFDYGLIDMVRDAASRLLKPNGVIIPDRLKLFVAGASSPNLREMAGAWSASGIPQEYRWLDEQNRNCKFGVEAGDDDLSSSAQLIGEVQLDADAPEFFSFTTELRIEKAGLFDGIVGWFDCHLGGDIWMTNSPIEERGIERPQAFLPALAPFSVEAGDRVPISLRFKSSGEMIAWTITPPNRRASEVEKQKLSTFNSTALDPADLIDLSSSSPLLSMKGEARARVLSLVNGERSFDEIVAHLESERAEVFPKNGAAREFVEAVIKRDCVFPKAD